MRMHVRAQAATVQRDVAAKHVGATRVECVALQPDGATWACGVVFRAESLCVLANVSVFGSVTSTIGHNRCDGVRELAALIPTPTAQAVAVDVQRSGANAGAFRCAKLPAGTSGAGVRWACQGAGPSDCRLVRVVAWTPFNPAASTRCSSVPALARTHG